MKEEKKKKPEEKEEQEAIKEIVCISKVEAEEKDEPFQIEEVKAN
jgi:hypothetical protein